MILEIKLIYCCACNKEIFANKKTGEKIYKYAIFSKCGKGGSTYGSPEMLFDFLISADIDIKYDILNWSLKDKLKYKNFLLCIK